MDGSVFYKVVVEKSDENDQPRRRVKISGKAIKFRGRILAFR